MTCLGGTQIIGGRAEKPYDVQEMNTLFANEESEMGVKSCEKRNI